MKDRSLRAEKEERKWDNRVQAFSVEIRQVRTRVITHRASRGWENSLKKSPVLQAIACSSFGLNIAWVTPKLVCLFISLFIFREAYPSL